MIGRLSEYGNAQKRVDEILEEYQKYLDRATQVTSSIGDGIHSSNISDKVADNAVKMADISNGYIKLWLEAEEKQLKLLIEISKFPKKYRDVIKYRYIYGMDWNCIAEKMGLEYSTVTTYHGEALEEYAKILENQNNT